jgi:hypothetical protein
MLFEIKANKPTKTNLNKTFMYILKGISHVRDMYGYTDWL